MSIPSDRIKTRFLVISDTHSADLSQSASNNDAACGAPLPKADVLLHCGDLTMVGRLHEYEKTLDMLQGIDADLKLVIAGNHDISLDEEYYERKGQYMHRWKGYDRDLPRQAQEMWKGRRAQQAGVTYLEEGTHTFTLSNGARLRVYASPYQPEFCDWAFPYFRNQDRYNPADKCTPNAVPIAENPVPDFPSIDVMMTHGPPYGVLDATTTGEKVGCQHLLRAARRCRPQLHCFGHIHEAWGAQRVQWKDDDNLDVNPEAHVERHDDFLVDEQKMKDERAAYINFSNDSGTTNRPGRETLMLNASIMTVQYKPWNSPWLIDLNLEKAEGL